MGMLKKIFNWKASDKQEIFDAQTNGDGNDARRNQRVQHSQNLHVKNSHERTYRSEPELDMRQNALRGSLSKAAHPYQSGILNGFNQSQEVSSTVVCDFGEMDAASPTVQQVTASTYTELNHSDETHLQMVEKIAVVGAESLAQTPKSRNSLRRRDSWPPKLHNLAI